MAIEDNQITKQAIDEALVKNEVWDLGNDVLYDLCASHPFHKTKEEVIAKVWLIGRAYAAAIERRKNKKPDTLGDLFYENKVAPAIISSGIDGWVALLKKEPTPENAIEIHFRLTALFCEITGHQNRSLASKYLHFHFRDLFFIYDSRAMEAVRILTPSSKTELKRFPLNEFKSEYANFYRRCLWLQDHLQARLGFKSSPRQIDKILIHFADAKRKQNSIREN